MHGRCHIAIYTKEKEENSKNSFFLCRILRVMSLVDLMKGKGGD